LTTLVLHRSGFDLKGLYSLEEYYARNLGAYYKAISIGRHHNYYFGREKADITPWIGYFVSGMLDSFESVAHRAGEAAALGQKDKSALLRNLTPRERKVLTLFEAQAVITANEVAALFGFSGRSARLLCTSFVNSGFLVVNNPAPKTRSYRLTDEYETLL
jgi:Fic family protein